MPMTRDQVLALLKASRDYLSGEEMSRRLGISRAAVHAAVVQLRKEGYEVLSATNRGYLLAHAPDRLGRGEILPWIPEGREERVLFLESVESTNAFLRRQTDAPGGMTVVADEQTDGRGRLGRAFYSPRGSGVYLSMLVRPKGLHQDAAGVSACAAVAVCDSIEAACGIRPLVKWVNDLMLGGKKICGILTELAVEAESGHIRHLIVGAGVNVSQRQEDFPPELREIATSIRAATGKTVDRGRLAGEMICRLDAMFEDWPGAKGRSLEIYRRDCVTLGKDIRISDGNMVRSAVAEAIGDDFQLVARFPDGHRESLRYGEVSVRNA